ncbi:hypothetical protein RFK98_07810 [Streptococcus suis]|uniref:hypothetical protein n=1 Tax=Streptococcus suis TaxID=1307 RepID=UPI002FCA3842
MEFENQLEKDIVQQKEDMIKRLAFETAKRLNGIKPTSAAPIYKYKEIQQTEKKKVRYGLFNLFSKDVEEIVNRRVLIEENYNFDGWILDDSLFEDDFELRSYNWASWFECRHYYVLNKAGHLEFWIFSTERIGKVPDGSFPNRDNFVEIVNETRLMDFTDFLFNDGPFASWRIPAITLLDIPRNIWTTKQDSGRIIVRNHPDQIGKIEQHTQFLTKSDIVANYGDRVIKILQSL